MQSSCHAVWAEGLSRGICQTCGPPHSMPAPQCSLSTTWSESTALPDVAPKVKGCGIPMRTMSLCPGPHQGGCPSSMQASVYCVAAVLWAAAKFSVPRDHKLALPRRLKALLLDMARRSAQERPSAAEAIQVSSHARECVLAGTVPPGPRSAAPPPPFAPYCVLSPPGQ